MLLKSFTYFPLLLLLFFFSCSKGHGYSLVKKNITLYYEDEKHSKIAEEVLLVLDSMNLSPDHKMDIKLQKKDTKFQLLLIKAEAFKTEVVDFDEIKLLLEFQQLLNEKVATFRTTPCELAIANNQFEVIEIPNPL
jgi:hypothetical protein